MSAWTKLLAASSLAIGTAWDLISNPKTGGSGVVVNNGATIALADTSLTIALDDASRPIALVDAPIGITLPPGITAQITTNQITV